MLGQVSVCVCFHVQNTNVTYKTSDTHTETSEIHHPSSYKVFQCSIMYKLVPGNSRQLRFRQCSITGSSWISIIIPHGQLLTKLLLNG